MEHSILGSSGLKVSKACLGTMTWGIQNCQRDADRQLAMALDAGVNFVDTAELYPVPPEQAYYGETERILGNWLARHLAKRSDLVIATKIAGSGVEYIRGGGPITGSAVIEAVNASLKRLQTDYIDLFQLHWPNRQSPHFGRHWPGQLALAKCDVEKEVAEMLDILRALQKCVHAGKIRFCGLSDDTTWGISQFLRLSELHDLPRIVSIQNEFNLLHTKDWPYLIEHCHHENVAYLPWSPLAGGMLSGKYLKGARPEGSRWTLPQRMGLFRNTPTSDQAIEAYCELAKQQNVTPSQLALQWCSSLQGVTSTIIGATSLVQLKENLSAFEHKIDKSVSKQVRDVLRRYPSPF